MTIVHGKLAQKKMRQRKNRMGEDLSMKRMVFIVVIAFVFFNGVDQPVRCQPFENNGAEVNSGSVNSSQEDSTKVKNHGRAFQKRNIHGNRGDTIPSLDVFSGTSSLTITPNNDPDDLLSALLSKNTGIQVTSVAFSGASTAAGLFQDGPFNIKDGILLASGDVVNALPPDTSDKTSTDFGLPGCSECDVIIPAYESFDAAKLELLFSVSDECSSICFDFVFGSEEYPEYVGTDFNDVFGAYLNGVQIAFDENGAAITINGPFFTSGYVRTPVENGLEYDGSTLKLKTIAPVVPGSIDNTLLFVICDAGDHILDSGVFLADLEGGTAGPDTCTGIPPEFDHPPTPVCNSPLLYTLGDDIIFDVQASDPGPNNDSVILTVSGLPGGAEMSPPLPITGNPAKSTFSWKPSSYSDVGTYTVFFTAEDAEECHFTEKCNITITIEYTVSVGPNPFTPNQDGFNDVVYFSFESMELESPVLNIFSMNGREIVALDQPSGSEFCWDGKNEDGDDQRPGVYIYLLQDGSEEIASGTIVLAR
jgi:hypothetical protein